MKALFLPFAGQRGEEEARGAEAAHGGRAEARGGGAGQGGGGGRHPQEEGRASTAALRLGRMCDRSPAGRHQEGRLQAEEEPRVASPGGYGLKSAARQETLVIKSVFLKGLVERGGSDSQALQWNL